MEPTKQDEEPRERDHQGHKMGPANIARRGSTRETRRAYISRRRGGVGEGLLEGLRGSQVLEAGMLY